MPDEDVLADLLGDIKEDQVKINEELELFDVIEKPNSSQVRGAIVVLMNFAMVTVSTELQALIVKASKSAEVEFASNVMQRKII